MKDPERATADRTHNRVDGTLCLQVGSNLLRILSPYPVSLQPRNTMSIELGIPADEAANRFARKVAA